MSKVRPDELTLADLALRETFRKRGKDENGKPCSYVHPLLRGPLSHARRFVLDETASRFLSDLSHANCGQNATLPRVNRAIETCRILARLPHAITWIEYDARAERRRTLEAYRDWVTSGDFTNHDPSKPRLDVPELLTPRLGWLLRQHPSIDTAFRCTTVVEEDTASPGQGPYMLPWDEVWVTDDSPLPHWPRVDGGSDRVIWHVEGNPEQSGPVSAAFVIGVPGYHNPHFGMIENAQSRLWRRAINQMMHISMGGLRPVLTLLAAINDIPIGVKHVTQTHGFVAQGRYRKFLSHSVITITLPKGRDPQKVARAIIAAARRRAHQVRGHWRRDWRHEGNRIWIKEHQRGDASLGFVTHDYRVEHPVA
jgi:hypothetical protein